MTRQLSPRSTWTKRTIALWCVGVLALTACGTRLDDAEIAVGAGGPVGAVGGVGAAGGDLPDIAAGPAVGDVGSPGAGAVAGGGTSAGGVAAPGAGVSPGVTGPATGAGVNGGPNAGTGGGAKGAAGSGSAGGAGGAGVKPGAACTSQGAPIIIGQDGSFSGLVGQTTLNLRVGMSVWAKYINSIGGLACRPVQLYQTDNASDPSKTSANINNLVRNKKAIAIVGLNAPIVIAAARSTAAQLGVPIIGGDLTATDWTEDANIFPPGGSPLSVYGGAIVQAVKDTGLKKLGLVYCVEASICGAINKAFPTMVEPSGGTIVSQQSASLTQSSFTSECQSAKTAGVQVVFTVLDSSSLQRFASSCNSVGYRPTYVTSGIAASPTTLNDANLKAAGLYIGNHEVPYFLKDLPALRTFDTAFAQFFGGPAPDQPSLKGWVSGQMFAAAINALGAEARSGTLSADSVYRGLYLLKKETLNGLIPPMTYVKGSPSPIVPCYTTFKIAAAGISAPNGSRFTCS